MNRKTSAIAILSVAVLAAAGIRVWYLLNREPETLCPFSGRGIQTKARVWVSIGKYETCCVRCAITEAQQTGKPLRVLEVGDFETGKLLAAHKACFVEGSPVNL